MDTATMPRPPAGKKAKDEEANGELQSIRIELAKNGFSVRCEYGAEGKNVMDYTSENHVFNSAGETAQFVKEQLEEYE